MPLPWEEVHSTKAARHHGYAHLPYLRNRFSRTINAVDQFPYQLLAHLPAQC